MPKSRIQKGDLKTYLRQSQSLLKSSVDPVLTVHFALTMLFISSLRNAGHPRAYLPAAGVLQRGQSNAHDDIAEAVAEIEDFVPFLKGAIRSTLDVSTLDEAALNQYLSQSEQFRQDTGIFETPERFGVAFEIAIEQLAHLSVRKGVDFTTQPSLARLLAEITKPAPGMTIYDPTAGAGGLLIEAARAIQRQGGDPHSTRLIGREKDRIIWSIARMNAAAHELWEMMIEHGDTLASPAFPPEGTVDLVLQSFPVLADGKTSPREEAALLRHALRSLAPHGKAAILSPSYLIQHNHRELWESVFKRDWLEAVISLPPMLLQGTHAGAVLLLLNKQKSAGRREQVLFIDAAPENSTTMRRLPFRDGDVGRIVECISEWKSIPGYARIMLVEQIRAQDYSLSTIRYMDWRDETPDSNLETALERYRTAEQTRSEAMEELFTLLGSLNIPVSRDGKRGKPGL